MVPHAVPRFTGRAFELRFDPLEAGQASLSFPCDAHGRVDLDGLGDRSRCDYLFAHTLIGRSFTAPVVQDCAG